MQIWLKEWVVKSDSPPMESGLKKRNRTFRPVSLFARHTPCLWFHRKATKCRCWVIAFWEWFLTWRCCDCNVTNFDEYSTIQDDVNRNMSWFQKKLLRSIAWDLSNHMFSCIFYKIRLWEISLSSVQMKLSLRNILLGVVTLILVGVLIQLIPYGHDHSDPPVIQEPNWNSSQTREIAKRA